MATDDLQPRTITRALLLAAGGLLLVLGLAYNELALSALFGALSDRAVGRSRAAQLAMLLMIVVSPFAIAWAASVPADIPLPQLLSSLTGILFSTGVGASYAWLRVSRVRASL